MQAFILVHVKQLEPQNLRLFKKERNTNLKLKKNYISEKWYIKQNN